MKDVIEFLVVGTKYLPQGLLKLQALQEGTVLHLIAEPDNQFDKNAIKVLIKSNNEHIGYVPNKGLSCKHCWTHMSMEHTSCPGCGAGWDFVVEGGLATRLLMTQALERDYACYVISLNSRDRYNMVKAKLVTV